MESSRELCKRWRVRQGGLRVVAVHGTLRLVDREREPVIADHLVLVLEADLTFVDECVAH